MSEVSQIYEIIHSLNSFGDLNVCSCNKNSSQDLQLDDDLDVCIRDLCDDCELECHAEFIVLPDLEMFLCTVNPELERITLALIGHALDRDYLEEQ